MTATNDSLSTPPTIISFAKDLANLCSLAGLFSAVMAVYFAIIGNFPAAMIGLVWAVFFDWSDGNIARRMKGRTDEQRKFGGQLDSLIDIVSFGVCPAVVLLSYGDFSPWFIPGAFIIVAAGVLRLSYFNVFGMASNGSAGKTSFQGLAIDNNGIFLVLLFVFHDLVSTSVFTVLLYSVILTLAALNVAQIRTPKLSSSAWYYWITVYTLVMSLIYGWRILQN